MVDARPASATGATAQAKDGFLVVRLGRELRCLSSAVLGGGMGRVRTWLNAQVPSDYARTDPEDHLREAALRLALPGPVVGMLTAVLVEDFVERTRGCARVFATVGTSDPLSAGAAKAGHTDGPGTINVFAVVDAPLEDAALVGAVCTAVEAKAAALGEAGVRSPDGGPATGTPTDSVCVACPPDSEPGGGAPFAGPASPVGRDLARAVREAVAAGQARYEARRPRHEEL